MIEYDGKRWISVIVHRRGSIAGRLVGRVLACAAVGGLAVWVEREHAIAVTPIAHTMIGVALGLLLVFRTNASYDRYWEGRRLLGGMVIRIRDLVRQVVSYLPGDEHRALRDDVRRLACAYFRLAAQLLRSERDLAPLGDLLTAGERTQLDAVRARPQVVSTWITRRLAAAGLHESRLFAMDQNLTGLTDALAGCERILRTPVPFAYAQHIKIFCVLFCFTAPFTMAESMGWATPVAAGLLAFALFGVDEIGVEIEDPFGYDPNDLPVDAMGDGIEAVTKEMVAAH